MTKPPTAPRHVAVFAIGPVQPFIAAARRTRDLWYGSALLSRLSAAVAVKLGSDFAADLVFPANVPAHGQRGQASGVSNKVVCVLHHAHMPVLATALKKAALDELMLVGDEALKLIDKEKCRADVDETRLRTQLGQVLEFFSAWAPWPEDDEQAYLLAYRRANAMLDARKRLRNFSPNAAAGVDLALSSLDAAAETVILPAPDRDRQRLRLVFGIDRTEELDALGLIKRVLGRAQRFPAVTRVALAPWVATWSDAACGGLDTPMNALAACELASRNGCAPGDPAARLPWDAEVLLPSRRVALRQRATAREQTLGLDPGAVTRAMDALESHLRQHEAELPLPPGDDALYVALLVADGDHMGRLLDEGFEGLPSPLQGHQKLSTQLAAFAAAAPALVQGFGGTCIYSGGDDVMALCPATTALQCARALADAFTNSITAAPVGSPSLSVGVGLAHVLTPFAELRALAERAQQLAKRGEDGRGLRNALGLIVQPRNGSAVAVCGPWSEPQPGLVGLQPGLDRRLVWWAEAFAKGDISQSAPYDLHTLARKVPQGALPAEAQRLFGRRLQGARGPAALAHLMARLQAAHACADDAEPHQRLAREWYVARWLAGRQGPPPVAAAATPPGDPAPEVAVPVDAALSLTAAGPTS